MSLIYFYDATELDKEQLTNALRETDHHWEYVPDKIDISNLNPDTEVISIFVTSTVTREIIEALPRLRLISCRSTGFNNIDLAAAEEHGVTVTNVPTYGDATVAEYAFTLLLALVRKLPLVLRTENEQIGQSQLTGTDLQGKTFGVIGTGHIGQKSLKIANGFSMKTLAYDAFPRLELQDELHFKYAELDELVRSCDIISIHAPYLPSTRHIINRERLQSMKPGAILINTARGELVDTAALIEALDSGHLGGAAIDVVEGESLLSYHEEAALLRSSDIPADLLRHSVEISALQKMPNVIVSPHNAFNTIEAVQRINETAAKNIIDYWYGVTANKVSPPPKQFGKLLLARHAESEWNATGQWTGITDVHLSEKGFHESALFGQALKDLGLPVDIAYCSEQIRTRETLEGMLNASQQFDVDIVTNSALNERDYGEYTGKNKWEMKELLGEEAFNRIRRGWNEPIPGGETLKMVYERVVPFYKETILPLLLQGKNVLIVAHGNSIRALMKYLESISDEDIGGLEMLFGQIIIYDVTPEGLRADSSVTKIDTTPPNA
ncbi:MAG TPA: 2,3-bisphosphoglycerate-dependent phosphoglycerate mutase [Candidatus Saccharimonadales bacterium]|nr:2,3-bisphosphoglycerate-dependent phosphoglycerate mutase [Candidatus Saccharimonadales bacterium]